jgi:two-component system, sensor histidine kinase and response regulator
MTARTGSSRLSASLVAAFRSRLLDDSRLVLFGHTASLMLVVALIWRDEAAVTLIAWSTAVLLVTLVRVAWQYGVGRGHLSDRATVTGTRVLVLAHGAAWGIGASLLEATGLPFAHAALVLIIFAGLLSTATNTFVADRPSMYAMLGAMLAPILGVLLATATDRDHVIAAIMVVVFASVMLHLHGRANRALLERLRTDFKLEDSLTRFRRVTESNILGICFWDRSGAMLDANDELLRALGFTREDLAQRKLNWRSLSPPEYVDSDTAALQAVLSGQTCPPWEKELFRKDGTRVPVLVGLAPLRESNHDGVAFVLDISKRKAAEAQARWKAALLDAQLHSSDDGVVVVDELGRKILQNQRLNELWAIPPAIANDVDDRKSVDFILASVKEPATFRARIEHLYAHRTEVGRDEIELTDGTVLDRYTAPVMGARGEYFGRIFSFHDVTEHKRLTEAMREARDQAERAVQTRSIFLANMSHEIRTPMNAVLGMVEIVLDTDLTHEQRHSLELVRSSAESLLGVLNDVLDYSKIEADRLDIDAVAFDLPRLVYTTAGLLAVRAQEKEIELIPDVCADVPQTVRGDPTRLRQVLTNLMGNAVKFTSSGEVVVCVEPAQLADGSPAVAFTVRDTGIGIPADRLDRIFEEFTQADGSTSRRYGGTGLGLTIAQRLVQLMGGRITVKSEVGHGSEFAFTIALPAEDAPAVVSVPASVSLAGKRVLVVDDNSINRRIFRQALVSEGAFVDEAKDAAGGLVAMRSAAADRPYALTLLDVRMAGSDGFDFARQVRSDPAIAGTPLLLLTSAGHRGDAAQCRELGISGYLTKPVARSELLEIASAILNGVHRGEERAVVTRHTLAEVRQRLRILLAEDVVVNQEVAATMLRKRGHQVDVVSNGREAVTAVQREPYDLILMDIQMPEMDGFEATAAIRALGERGAVPIVALTAHALSGERERCMAQGMDGYIAKPFKAHELFATVEGWRATSPAPENVVEKQVTAAVDLDVLRAQLRAAGAEDSLRHVVDTFLDSVTERIAALRDALANGTAASVARAAHAFKSSAAVIGAGSLAALLAEIEADGRAEQLPDRASLADRVRDAAAAVVSALRDHQAKAA